MKEGDLLYCYENYNDIFKKGVQYKINGFHYSRSISIISSIQSIEYFYVDTKYLPKHLQNLDSLQNLDRNYGYSYLFDYFTNDSKKIRKMKLEKIYDNTN